MSGSLAVVVAGMLGLLLGWLFARHQGQIAIVRLEERESELQRARQQLSEAERLKADVARLQAELAGEKRNAAERLAAYEEARQMLRETFAAISMEALNSSNEQFLQIAEARFAKLQESATTSFETKQKAIADLVKPIEDGLKKVDERIGTVEKERVDAYADLRRHVEEMGKGQQQLQTETQNLVRALRSPHVRGAWGEIQLRRVVEMAGMQEHCDFDEQVTVGGNGAAHLRPDLVVSLPGDKCIVVDSKAPLDAYLRAVELADDSERAALMQQHASQVRQHISQLAARSYWSQFPNAPDFVVMFLPGESFFSAACQSDPTLINYAVDQRVIPASPTTLITLLRTVQFGWRQERIAESAEEIRKLGQTLYERMRTLAGHLGDMGKGLTKAIDSYNNAVGSFESRALTGARKFTELGAGEGELIPEIQPVGVAVRAVQVDA